MRATCRFPDRQCKGTVHRSCLEQGSNLQLSDPKSDALPIELSNRAFEARDPRSVGNRIRTWAMALPSHAGENVYNLYPSMSAPLVTVVEGRGNYVKHELLASRNFAGRKSLVLHEMEFHIYFMGLNEIRKFCVARLNVVGRVAS